MNQYIFSMLLFVNFFIIFLSFSNGNIFSTKTKIKEPSSQTAIKQLSQGLFQCSKPEICRYGKTKGSALDIYTPLFNGQFKAYRPDIFTLLRKNAGISEAMYLEHTLMNNLKCLNADSKSGQAFFKSKNGYFIIKTIKHYEAKNLFEILDYLSYHVQYENMIDYQPSSDAQRNVLSLSLLSNLLGMYRIKLSSGEKIYVLVSKNIYSQPIEDMDNLDKQQLINNQPNSLQGINPKHFKYDLKGSLIGRKKAFNSAVFKDLDLIDFKHQFQLGNKGKELLLHILQSDIQFLSKFSFMDYSLLVEIEEPSLSLFRRFFRQFIYPISFSRSDR